MICIQVRVTTGPVTLRTTASFAIAANTLGGGSGVPIEMTKWALPSPTAGSAVLVVGIQVRVAAGAVTFDAATSAATGAIRFSSHRHPPSSR